MPYKNNTDLPKYLVKGLSEVEQNLMRGIICSAMYDDELSKEDAFDAAHDAFVEAGYIYSSDGWKSSIENNNTELIKIDEDKRLVFGWAQVVKDYDGKTILDRQSDFIDNEEVLEDTAYEYVLKSRSGGEMHVNFDVATLVESIVFTNEKMEKMGITAGTLPVAWWVGFYVTDDNVWRNIKEGNYSGFSVGGTAIREEAEVTDPSIG